MTVSCFKPTLYGVLALIVGSAIAGCSPNKAPSTAQAAPAPAPVSVSNAVSKSLPLEVQAVGNAESYSTVTVKAQVGGELTKVEFQEGADVKKGDRLFVIDPRSYESQVTQAEANLAKDKAQLQAAQANLARDVAQEAYASAQSKRYAELSKQGVLSKDSAEQTSAQAAALQEAVRADNAAIESARANSAADQAALDRARLQLEYCTILSPIDGRTGHLLVKQGNVIKAIDQDLITINQLRPIFVTFAIPEANLSAIKSHMASGRVRVLAQSEGVNAAVESGTLTFVENAVDSATGTIRLKALFENPRTTLWPGEFVRVVVRLNESAEAIVVPVTAVQTGQDGKFVFVVKSDMTVEARPVVTSRTVGREIIIEKGLSAGETVVTEGQLRLVPGSRVQVKSTSSPQS
jgi:multidrug efflux system membrane fusion protein